jgi:hypothetical protein
MGPEEIGLYIQCQSLTITGTRTAVRIPFRTIPSAAKTAARSLRAARRRNGVAGKTGRKALCPPIRDLQPTEHVPTNRRGESGLLVNACLAQ